MRATLSASKRARVVKGAKFPGGVSVATVEAREKRAKAVELRKAGATYDEIARTVGYTDATAARRAVLRAIERLNREPTVAAILLEIERLDEYQKRCTAQLRQTNDLGQIDRLMRIMEMRLRLMGVTPEIVREIADRAERSEGAATITNNGVIVIQGTEEDFLKGIMTATGANPKLADQYLKEQAKKKRKVVRRKKGRKIVIRKDSRVREIPQSTVEIGEVDTSSVYPHMDAEGHTLQESEILDAEIVDE